MLTTQDSIAAAPPRRRSLLRRSFPSLSRAAAALRNLLLAERDRWLLWLPVFYGTGIALYFLPADEPPARLGAVLLAAALVAVLGGLLSPALLQRRRSATGLLPLFLLPLLLLAAGFAVAQWRSHAVAAPVLARETGPLPVAGRVVAVEPLERAGQWRITVADLSFPGREGRLPALDSLRLTVRTGGETPAAGLRVETLAILFPPGAPELPGGFDFGRTAWFQGLGAVGIALAPLRRAAALPGEGGDLMQALRDRIARLRRDLAARIIAAMPAPEGAVAAALLTGERGAIPERVVAAYRDSGIAHLLAISGLHLALVAGLLFVVVRAALAALPGLALNAPIKKWAALCALAAALAYLVLTGAAVSAQRATLMAALVLLAVLLDRMAISMRSVAWAACLVLTLAPESLLSPGFQMSFAAVVALIASYEWPVLRGLSGSLSERGGLAAPVLRGLLYLGAVLATTVVAGLATAPYAAFHFHRLVDYGLLANLVAVPLTSLWVMPLGIAAYLLMPLQLEELALAPMGWGLAVVNAVAAEVAAWPGAVRLVPQMPGLALGLLSLGGLWLCLWRRPWRLVGLVGIAAGLWMAATAPLPDLLADAEGRSFAVRLDDRLLFRQRGDLRRREAAHWSEATALQADAPWPRAGRIEPQGAAAEAAASLACDPEGCLYSRGGRRIALPLTPDALVRDCREADAVLAPFAVRQSCPGPERIVDIRTLRREGGAAIRIEPDGSLVVETVAERRGRRLWSGAAD